MLIQHPVTGVTCLTPGHSVSELSWAERAEQAAAAVVSEVPGPQDPMVIQQMFECLTVSQALPHTLEIQQ